MAASEPRLAALNATPFVGRQDERALITSLIERTLRGNGEIVLVSGEAGLGKSRLAHELALAASSKGFSTFKGHCYETEAPLPCSPFVEVFESFIRAAPLDTVRTLIGDAAPEMAKLVPEIRRVLPETPAPMELAGEQERHFLFNRIRDFLERLSTQQPAFILLEDLQWADVSTLLLLQHLALRLRGLSILFLGTFREEDLDVTRPFARTLEELLRTRVATRVSLKPLSPGDVHTMLRLAGGVEPPVPLSQAIYRETEGNPFFVEEVFRHLDEEGKLFDPRGRWRSDIQAEDSDVPESIRLLLGRRLDRLTQSTREVLTIAALIGNSFDLSLVNALVTQSQVPGAIEEAERARLIIPNSARGEVTFVFAHELIRQTLIHSMSAPGRRDLHLKIADAIQQVYHDTAPEHASALASHLYQAGSAADPAITVEYLKLAGERAKAATAHEDAARLFERAIEVLTSTGGGDRDQCELLVALGEALWSSGDLTRASECFTLAAQRARGLDAEQLLAPAVLGLGEGWGWAPNELLAGLLQDVLNALPREDSALRAKTMARLAVELQGIPTDNLELREHLSVQAVEMARRMGDDTTLAYALGCWGSVFMEIADPSVRLAAANEALRTTASGYWTIVSHQQRITTLLQLGDIGAADSEAKILERLAEEQREPFIFWESLRFKAMRSLLEGGLNETERLVEQHRAFAAQMGVRGASLTYSVQILLLRCLQGRAQEIERPARASVTTFPADVGVRRAALAFIYCELGQEADARREFEELTNVGLQTLGHQRGWVLAAALLSDVCAFLKNAREAQILYDMILPLADCHLVSRGDAYLGAAGRYLGNLADTLGLVEVAEQHFEQALEMNARLGARPALAQTQYDYGRMLLTRRRSVERSKAKSLLEKALESAEELGMQGLAVRTRKVLEAPAFASRAYPGGLSPREVDVLILLAEGRTSREIGEDLVLSVRTVERHITNIYRKVDAHNRAQATAFALEHGLTRR